MQRIFPITEEACKVHCGKPVLIYLNDGSEIYAILSRVEQGRLIFNDVSASVSTDTRKKLKSSLSKNNKRKAEVQTSAFYGPYPYGFGAGALFAIELAAIAALFAFPFFI